MKNLARITAVLFFGLIGWMLSELTFYLSKVYLGSYLAVLIHFVLSPLLFIILAYIYFRYINLTGALLTAIIVTSILIVLDFFVVALLIENSFKMFTNVMATWMPFIFVFFSVFLTGMNFNDSSLS